MTPVHSFRDFHSKLASVCASIEAVINLAGPDHEEVELAVRPAMQQFHELLDAADLIAGPDTAEEGAR